MMAAMIASVLAAASGSADAARRVLAAAIVSRAKGLARHLVDEPKGDLFAAQEHKAEGDKLSSQQ
eukprot:503858-Pyramimonas_sp.AAC.1